MPPFIKFGDLPKGTILKHYNDKGQVINRGIILEERNGRMHYRIYSFRRNHKAIVYLEQLYRGQWAIVK